ncbi:hypothetical protein pb186bvf_010915 [Paramecium bursaria]
MSLRKLGQQSYFQQKRMTQPQNESIQEDESQAKIIKTLLSEKASTPKLIQNSSASSQLLNRYKKSIKISSFKTEESFNHSPIKQIEKKEASVSYKEQQYQIKKLNDWAQEKEKKVEKKKKEFQQKDGLQKKPTVNKLSKSLADQMMKKFNSVELKIDVKVQADFGDFKPLERWNSGKKVKVKVDKYDVVEDYDKEVQTNETMMNKVNLEIPNNDEQHQLKKQSGQIQNYYMPIHERAKYEILLKNQKLQKQRQAEQQQVVEPNTEKVKLLYDLECDKAKAENFWEEQKRFMQDKKDSIAKLQQDRLNALLDLEESFSFKPRINKESRELANKTHDKNFDDRIQRFVNTKQTHLELQKELLKPQFQPQINNKSRRLARSTDGYNSQR